MNLRRFFIELKLNFIFLLSSLWGGVMPKVVMVVVLYNKMLKESSTLQSLLSFTSLDHLVIVNNGPKNIILISLKI